MDRKDIVKSENRFGDCMSWENHVQEILNKGQPIESIYYGKQSHSERIDKIKKYKPNGKLLDCGCHIGRFINTFRDNGYDYTGVDQSSYALKIAKIYQPTGKWVHSLLWEMNFNEEFDIVHFNAVLQHNLLKEQEKIIQKVYQALKKGGILFIAESTVTRETRTQRSYRGWIEFIESNGFKFLESFHKNELGIDDNYIFVKL